MNLSPVPIQKFFDNNGAPLVSGLLFTYVAGTSTKIATYTDSTGGTPNTNPIVLNFRGECALWLDPTLSYKLVIAPSTDTDPPNNAFWTADNVRAGVDYSTLTQQFIGQIFYPRSQAEISAGVTPVNYYRYYGDVLRYGTNTTPGTTDMTTAIQSALNCNTVVLFPANQTYLSSGNQVQSNRYIKFEQGAIIKAANGINRPVLQNANYQSSLWGGSTYGLDSNITFEGLYVDGNQANQAHTGSGPYAGEFTSGVRFFGVTNLKFIRTTIFQARTFAVWLCAIYNLTVDDIRFDQYMGGTPDNQDGLHINGPAKYLSISNVRGSTNDDMVALNADDGPLGSNVTAGPIISAEINGVFAVDCLNGVRLLSATSRMDQIIVKNVIGSTRDVAVNQSPYGLGVGNVGSLTIESVDCRCANTYSGSTSDYYSVITLDGVIDSVGISNVSNNRPFDNRPTIRVAGTANIGLLSINGLRVTEAAGSTLTGVLPISVYGRIDTMMVRGVGYFRDSTLTATGTLLTINAPTKGITNLVCSDWLTERLVSPISLVDGTLNNLSCSNINDKSGLTSFSLVTLSSATGATTNVSMFNCITDYGRKLIAVSGSSSLGSRSTIDNAGASGATVTLSGNQAVALGSYVKLLLTNIVFDRVTGEYSSANSQFTVSQGAGVYMLSYTLDITIPTNPTDLGIAIYKNGASYRVIPGSQRFFTNACVGGQTIVQANQGDVFEVRLFCSANVTVNNTANTVVSYERLK